MLITIEVSRSAGSLSSEKISKLPSLVVTPLSIKCQSASMTNDLVWAPEEIFGYVFYVGSLCCW